MSSKSQQFRIAKVRFAEANASGNTEPKGSKSVQIANSIRKFHTTRCPTCGNIDGIIEQIKNYDPKRDLYEWTREGRTIYEYIQKGKEQIPFCTCIPSDDPEFETTERK